MNPISSIVFVSYHGSTTFISHLNVSKLIETGGVSSKPFHGLNTLPILLTIETRPETTLENTTFTADVTFAIP